MVIYCIFNIVSENPEHFSLVKLPNHLVFKHFNRGPRLPDTARVRYEHVCKHCGENFAKGQSEILAAHLIERCYNFAEADRKEVLKKLSLGTEDGNQGALNIIITSDGQKNGEWTQN